MKQSPYFLMKQKLTETFEIFSIYSVKNERNRLNLFFYTDDKSWKMDKLKYLENFDQKLVLKHRCWTRGRYEPVLKHWCWTRGRYEPVLKHRCWTRGRYEPNPNISIFIKCLTGAKRNLAESPFYCTFYFRHNLKEC